MPEKSGPRAFRSNHSPARQLSNCAKKSFEFLFSQLNAHGLLTAAQTFFSSDGLLEFIRAIMEGGWAIFADASEKRTFLDVFQTPVFSAT